MKILKYITLSLVLMVSFAIKAQAKSVQEDHVYMFGFSASFNDSIIYVTDIQDVEGVWIETKGKLLMSRESYSEQLKDYFTEKMQQPNRVCITLFSTKKAKVEKKYKKLMKKYLPNPKKKNWKSYDVRYLTSDDFKFTPIDMSPVE